MAIYNPTSPPLFIHGTIDSFTVGDLYPFSDEPSLQNTIALTYNVEVSGISSQQTYTTGVRAQNQAYTGLDIKVGDYTTDKEGRGVYQIISIEEKTNNTIKFVVKDIDMLSYKVYGSDASPSQGAPIAFFELSDSGAALITGAEISNFFGTAISIDRIQGRFDALLESDSQRFSFEDQQSQVNLGDTVAIDQISGNFVKYGTSGSTEIALGIVEEFRMGGTVIYIKAFNKVIDNYPNPSKLTGGFGETYYTDPANPGEMTTTEASGSIPLFLQIKNAVSTVVTSNSSNYMPDNNDKLKINNIEVYDGANDFASITTTDDLVSRINTLTSSTQVTASKLSEFASVTSVPENTSFSAVMNIASSDSGNTYGTIDFDISDGTTTASVSLGDPADMVTNYGVNPTLVPYPGAAQYLTYDATAMALVLNSVFSANSIKLSASVLNNGETYKLLKITATEATASIVISGSDVDDFGQTFQVGSGLAATTPPVSNDFLVLTRGDGGDIMLTGDNNYWNVNGLTSSSLGSPAMLLMLEGVKDGGGTEEVATAEKTKVDLNKNPLVTTSDEDSTGITITYTPFNDEPVSIEVNGLECNIGDGAKDEACYFSGDGGATARTMEDITAGDTLYWMGSIAGYELETDDDIDIEYSKSSLD